jgi:hypothetical protein
MGKFRYLFISKNKETQNADIANKYKNDLVGKLYLKGDCVHNGQSIFNDGPNEYNRIKDIFGKKHTLLSGVESHADWSVEEFTAELWGTWLCIKGRVKSKVTIEEGNITPNLNLLKVDLSTQGAIKNIINVSFTNASAGPVCSFYTVKPSASVKDKTVKFGIVLSSIGSKLSAGDEISFNFSIPVALNYEAFPLK